MTDCRYTSVYTKEGHRRCSRFSANIQQISSMEKCDFSKIVVLPHWNHIPAWVLSWKCYAFLHNVFFEEHLQGTASVFFMYFFFIVKNKYFCLLYNVNFIKKISFTWWSISIVICRPAWVIKVRWWCHWRNKSWRHREIGKILPWCSWN